MNKAPLSCFQRLSSFSHRKYYLYIPGRACKWLPWLPPAAGDGNAVFAALTRSTTVCPPKTELTSRLNWYINNGSLRHGPLFNIRSFQLRSCLASGASKTNFSFAHAINADLKHAKWPLRGETGPAFPAVSSEIFELWPRKPGISPDCRSRFLGSEFSDIQSPPTPDVMWPRHVTASCDRVMWPSRDHRSSPVGLQSAVRGACTMAGTGVPKSAATEDKMSTWIKRDIY